MNTLDLIIHTDWSYQFSEDSEQEVSKVKRRITIALTAHEIMNMWRLDEQGKGVYIKGLVDELLDNTK